MYIVELIDHHAPQRGIWVINNPFAPIVENPNEYQLALLSGYWASVIKNADLILDMQRDTPGWLPPLNLLAN